MTDLIIGIDHGNANIKTAHCVFPADYLASDIDKNHRETLSYGGRYYALTGHSSPTAFDKTKNDKYYILTLFAVAKEIRARGLSGNSFDVVLNCGLPPGMMNVNEVEKFRRYLWKQKTVAFTFDGTAYTIGIKDVNVYPQALSACYYEKSRFDFTQKRSVIIIDVGGGTIEIVVLDNGQADLKLITSLPVGTNNFTAEIQRKIMGDYCLKVSGSMIGSVMNDEKDILLIPEAISAIRSCYEGFAEDIFDHAKMISSEEPSFSDFFLTGGGAGYISGYFKKLEKDKMIHSLFIQDDIRANACGYEAFIV